MTEREIQSKIIERSAAIAKVIAKDNDCEIRRDRKKGVKIIRVRKDEV